MKRRGARQASWKRELDCFQKCRLGLDIALLSPHHPSLSHLLTSPLPSLSPLSRWPRACPYQPPVANGASESSLAALSAATAPGLGGQGRPEALAGGWRLWSERWRRAQCSRPRVSSRKATYYFVSCLLLPPLSMQELNLADERMISAVKDWFRYQWPQIRCWWAWFGYKKVQFGWAKFNLA